MTPQPVPAVIAVVIYGDKVLLVRRKNPPDAGRWGFPGGKIEFGETIEAAAERELSEETTIRGEALHAFTAVDAFDHKADGAVSTHFVLIAVLCGWISGEPVAGDDALEVRWFDISALNESSLPMSRGVVDVARKAATFCAAGLKETLHYNP